MHTDCKGLMADLKAVRRALRQEVPIADFVAGAHDQLYKLHVSQKLYGREEQVRRLGHNFELVCEGSAMSSTLVLVHGYSGVNTSPHSSLLTAPPCSLVSASHSLVNYILFEKQSGWKNSSCA